MLVPAGTTTAAYILDTRPGRMATLTYLRACARVYCRVKLNMSLSRFRIADFSTDSPYQKPGVVYIYQVRMLLWFLSRVAKGRNTLYSSSAAVGAVPERLCR